MARLNNDSIRNERKEQIMRAALKVFADNGVKLTKISMIAKEATVSHGLVYHYFTSKEEVLFESLKWGVSLDKTSNFLKQLNEKKQSPLEKIKEFTMFALSEGDSTSTNVFRILQNLESTDDIPKELKDFTNSLGMMYIEFFIPIVIEGQQIGEIIQGDPEELVDLFLTIISGVMADNIHFWQENMDCKVNIFLRMLSVR